MNLTDRVWDELGELDAGVAKNAGPLTRQLGTRATNYLVELGHLERDGGRLLRTAVSANAYALFDALPDDGSPRSNEAAQRAAGLTAAAYRDAKALLLMSGEIERGRGRGGSIRRLTGVDPGARPGAVSLESELYEPFLEVLRTEEKQPGERYAWHDVIANGKQHRRATGQWSKPDAASIIVTHFDFLPGVDVSVHSYELKPYWAATNLSGVYEAAAHQRRAHYSTLVIEYPDDEPPEAVAAECARLGVGLWLMWDGEVTEVAPPQRDNPEPFAVSAFIADLIGSDADDYLRAIGKSNQS